MSISVKDAPTVNMANGWQVVHDAPTGTRLYWCEEKGEFTTNQSKGTVYHVTEANSYYTAEHVSEIHSENGTLCFVLPIVKIDTRDTYTTPSHDPGPVLQCICVCPVHKNNVGTQSGVERKDG